MKIITPSVALVTCTEFPEHVIERAGRVCYASEGSMQKGSHEPFVRGLIARGHESVLEHASASFRIVCDRGVSHELVRHRIASFSQQSTRYCNYSKDKFESEISVIMPVELPNECYTTWYDQCLQAERAYMKLLADGVKPQTARSVLPHCLATEITMTANFREWRLFLKQRLAPEAHPDMRVIANAIRYILIRYSPTVFYEFNTKKAT